MVNGARVRNVIFCLSSSGILNLYKKNLARQVDLYHSTKLAICRLSSSFRHVQSDDEAKDGGMVE